MENNCEYCNEETLAAESEMSGRLLADSSMQISFGNNFKVSSVRRKGGAKKEEERKNPKEDKQS